MKLKTFNLVRFVFGNVLISFVMVLFVYFDLKCNCVNYKDVKIISTKIGNLIINHEVHTPVSIIKHTIEEFRCKTGTNQNNWNLSKYFGFVGNTFYKYPQHSVLSHPNLCVDIINNLSINFPHSHKQNLNYEKISSIDCVGEPFTQYINTQIYLYDMKGKLQLILNDPTINQKDYDVILQNLPITEINYYKNKFENFNNYLINNKNDLNLIVYKN